MFLITNQHYAIDGKIENELQRGYLNRKKRI